MSKKLIIAIIIVVVVAAGAGYLLVKNRASQVSQEGNNQPAQGNISQEEGSNQNLYTGFMKLNPGAWSEVVMKGENSGKEVHRKVVYAGEAKINGKDAQGIEFEITQGDNNMIAQIWLEKGSYKPVRYVAKIEDQVFCVDPSVIESYFTDEEKPSLETPEEYKPTKPDISYGTYTTPTGKTVNVAKFKVEEGGESWVSSEVPFGLVKSIDNQGNDSLYLYDFGLSGGKIQITKDEVENCIPLPNVPNLPNIPLP